MNFGESYLRSFLESPEAPENVLRGVEKHASGDLATLERHAQYRIVLDVDGVSAIYVDTKRALPVIAILGPTQAYGKTYPLVVLEEIGLHSAIPFRNARFGSAGDGYVRRRLKLFSLSKNQLHAVLPVLCELIHDHVDDYCMQRKTFRSPTVKTIPQTRTMKRGQHSLSYTTFRAFIQYTTITVLENSPFAQIFLTYDLAQSRLVSGRSGRVRFLKKLLGRIKRLGSAPSLTSHAQARFYYWRVGTETKQFPHRYIRFRIQARKHASDARVSSYSDLTKEAS